MVDTEERNLRTIFNCKIKERKGIEQPSYFNECAKVLQFLKSRIT